VITNDEKWYKTVMIWC